jgi:DNA helicase-2/ATP-dependent DNA helicase PcrA
LANIEELLTAAREFDEQNPGECQLETFLELACLVNDTDAWEEETDKVTLMTLHAAKGLEFPVVYVVAVEDGLLPHERSRHELAQLEEERRLLFVAITRAQHELQLSYAIYREFRGQRRRTVPSSFLMELPRAEMDLVEPSYAEPVWDESQDIFQAEPPERERDAALSSTAAIMTAAQLADQATRQPARVSPDVFAQGMAVTHPEYGLGKIVALAGRGPKRRATVAFATAGEKKFVLASSALQPARQP